MTGALWHCNYFLVEPISETTRYMRRAQNHSGLTHKSDFAPPKHHIYIYVCVTFRNTILLRAAHAVAGPFVAHFSRASYFNVRVRMYVYMLAEVIHAGYGRRRRDRNEG